MRAKSVYEYVEFKRGLEPKTSLGLGEATFETLRDGDILKVKKRFSLSSTGVISSRAATTYRVGSYCIVYQIHRPDKYYISFGFIKIEGASWRWSGAEKTREDQRIFKDLVLPTRDQFLANKEEVLKRMYGSARGQIYNLGKRKFHNLFKIIDRF